MKLESPEKTAENNWFVYVIQSQQLRVGKTGNHPLGRFYVGAPVDVPRRLRPHNGEIKGAESPLRVRAHEKFLLYSPYGNRYEAHKAERVLKKSRRGVAGELKLNECM